MSIKDNILTDELKKKGYKLDKKGRLRDPKGHYCGPSPKGMGRPKGGGKKSIRVRVKEMSNDLQDYVELLDRAAKKGLLGWNKGKQRAQKLTPGQRIDCLKTLIAYGAGKPAQVMLERELDKKETLEQALDKIEQRQEEIEKKEVDENPVAEWVKRVEGNVSN